MDRGLNGIPQFLQLRFMITHLSARDDLFALYDLD